MVLIMGMVPVEQTIAIIEATKSEPNYWWLLLIALVGIVPGLIMIAFKHFDRVRLREKKDWGMYKAYDEVEKQQK